MNYKRKLSRILEKYIELECEEIEGWLRVSNNFEEGDYILPCFKLGGIYRKSPTLIAQALAERLKGEEFERVVIHDGVINIFINKEEFINEVAEEIVNNQFKEWNFGFGEVVCIAGASEGGMLNGVYNILQNTGYEVKSSNSEIICNKVWEELKERGLISRSNGVDVVSLKKYNMAPFIVRDENREYTHNYKLLSLINGSSNKYGFRKFLYIIGVDEEVNKRGIELISKELHFNWSESCNYIHLRGVKGRNIYEELKSVENFRAKKGERNLEKEFILSKLIKGFEERVRVGINELNPFIVVEYLVEICRVYDDLEGCCEGINEAMEIIVERGLKLIKGEKVYTRTN